MVKRDGHRSAIAICMLFVLPLLTVAAASGPGPAPEPLAEWVDISWPVNGTVTHFTNSSTISMGGNHSAGVSSLYYSNSANAASGAITVGSPWAVSDIPVTYGINNITVTASTSGGDQVDTLIVERPDLFAPNITLTAPSTNGSYYTSGESVSLSGAYDDNDQAVLTINNPAVGLTTTVTSITTNSWDYYNLPLDWGWNNITITAEDSYNNTAEVTIDIYRQDVDSPTLWIERPYNGIWTVATSIDFFGYANDAHNITLVTWEVMDQVTYSVAMSGTLTLIQNQTNPLSWDFSFTAPLEVGYNLINISATDPSGNSVVQSVTVTRQDLNAPVVTITEPVGNVSIDADQAWVNGTITDDGTVNAVYADNQVTGSSPYNQGDNESFAFLIDLVYGDNRIRVYANDEVGNQGEAYVTITRIDPDPPILNLVQPEIQPVASTDEWIVISGNSTDNNGIPTIGWINHRNNNSGEQSWDTLFFWDIQIEWGENLIEVWSEDSSGNRVNITFTATREDTEEPQLEIWSFPDTYSIPPGTISIPVEGVARDNQGVTVIAWQNAANGLTGTHIVTSPRGGYVDEYFSFEIPVDDEVSNLITFTAFDLAGLNASWTKTLEPASSDPASGDCPPDWDPADCDDYFNSTGGMTPLVDGYYDHDNVWHDYSEGYYDEWEQFHPDSSQGWTDNAGNPIPGPGEGFVSEAGPWYPWSHLSANGGDNDPWDVPLGDNPFQGAYLPGQTSGDGSGEGDGDGDSGPIPGDTDEWGYWDEGGNYHRFDDGYYDGNGDWHEDTRDSSYDADGNEIPGPGTGAIDGEGNLIPWDQVRQDYLDTQGDGDDGCCDDSDDGDGGGFDFDLGSLFGFDFLSDDEGDESDNSTSGDSTKVSGEEFADALDKELIKPAITGIIVFAVMVVALIITGIGLAIWGPK